MRYAFRAYDEKEKRMYYSNQEFPDNVKFCFNEGIVVCKTNAYNLPIERYSGLLDENGVELYEGDVVNLTVFNYEGLDTQHVCKVVSDDTGCLWFETIDEPKNIWPFYDMITEDDITIIGNIHEGYEL